jgi:hypothetical protein
LGIIAGGVEAVSRKSAILVSPEKRKPHLNVLQVGLRR